MLTLEELNAKSEEIFNQGLKTKAVANKDRLEIARELKLPLQIGAISYQCRLEQARELGFAEITPNECIRLMTGENPTHEVGSDYVVRYQAYNDIDDLMEDRRYRLVEYHFTESEVIEKEERLFLWSKPQKVQIVTKNELKWLYMSGPLSSLKMSIPYGVMLKIAELTKLKIFNEFMVYAPKECFSLTHTSVDPVITGRVMDLTSVREPKVEFFIAKW